MQEWKNDKELFDLIKNELNTLVVGDILDNLQYYHQILPQAIQLMRDSDKLREERCQF